MIIKANTTFLKTFAALISVLILSVSVNTYADSMRCKNRLVSTGDSKAKVLLTCGEPMLKEDHSYTVSEKVNSDIYRHNQQYNGVNAHGASREITRLINVEKWTYNPGRNKFLRIVTFKEGKIDSIETGERAN
ncbi:DUF2845 domain-containing protein [Spartinivicinus ruber]|uniref:DUF2845 domain-containing protein n=1 Tax=Spartinivicinus ruber TaxID=2683272 RepID=UPI0013D53A40|nr:DUF2845 domain-containing protein [Spartinivicinus ruber]